MSQQLPVDPANPGIEKLLDLDGYLRLHETEIRRRNNELKNWIARFEQMEGGLEEFTQGYKYYGLHIGADNSVTAREWAPGAKQLYLTGDFNNWQWEATPYKQLPYGKWELKIPPNQDGSCPIKHLSEIKVIVRKQDGQLVDRLSPWAKYVVPPPKSLGVNYQQRVWHPPAHEKYMFRHRERPSIFSPVLRPHTLRRRGRRHGRRRKLTKHRQRRAKLARKTTEPNESRTGNVIINYLSACAIFRIFQKYEKKCCSIQML